MIAADFILIPPNWGKTVRVKRKWMTSIQTALTGREKRTALYTWPRRSINYTLDCMNRAEIADIKRRLFKNMHNPIGIGLWPDRTYLTSGVTIGGSSLPVASTALRNFEVGGLWAIVENGVGFEWGEVASVSANSIGTVETLEANWSSGASVVPVIQVRLSSEQQLNLVTSRVGEISIEGIETYDEDVTYATHSRPYTLTYRSFPVFTVEPNWIRDQQFSMNHKYEFLQYLGKSYSYSTILETALKFGFKYTQFNKTDINKIVEFFDGSRGRFDSFWTPTWTSDLGITSAFTTGATTLYVSDYEYTGYWDTTEITGKHLAVIFPDNTISCTQVQSYNPGTGALVVDPGMSRGATLLELDRTLACFLLLARFDDDEIVIEYETEESAHIELGFHTTQLAEDEVVPPIWETAYEYTDWQGDSYDWYQYTLRMVIPASAISQSGSAVRITLGYAGTTYTLSEMWIGHRDIAGDVIDFDGNQAQVTFGGGSSYVTVTAAGVQSDTITFALDETKDLVVGMYFNNVNEDDIPASQRSNYAGKVYYITTAGASEASTEDVDLADYTDYSTTDNIDIVQEIEIYNG